MNVALWLALELSTLHKAAEANDYTTEARPLVPKATTFN